MAGKEVMSEYPTALVRLSQQNQLERGRPKGQHANLDIERDDLFRSGGRLRGCHDDAGRTDDHFGAAGLRGQDRPGLRHMPRKPGRRWATHTPGPEVRGYSNPHDRPCGGLCPGPGRCAADTYDGARQAGACSNRCATGPAQDRRIPSGTRGHGRRRFPGSPGMDAQEDLQAVTPTQTLVLHGFARVHRAEFWC